MRIPGAIVCAVCAVLGSSCLLAAPTVSPLAPTKDAVGESLQRTMIWTPPGEKMESNFVALRKSFVLPKSPRTVTLQIFADVRYLVWINGQSVLRGPARFEPAGPEYDSMDITRFLKPGGNEIAVLVMANGSNGKMRQHAPGLTARIDVDGKPFVATDATWKWSDRTRYRTPDINWGNTMDRIDATVEDGDWTLPGYNDTAWKSAQKIDGNQWGPLSARRTPLLRETPVPIKITGGRSFPITLRAGEKLEFQLDRLVQAYTILELDADAGTQLMLDYAGIQYVARGGRQVYISSDTHGIFSGSITVKSGRATIKDFKLVERLYPFDVVGSFKSNDEALNRLWALCARSCQVFSEDAYVDCADRERTEWMDCDPPAFDVTRTALAGPGASGRPLFSDARLLGAMLRRTALTLQPEGWVKAHTCSDRFDIHARMEDRACDWVEGARRYYESTGDKTLIREIWPVIVRQMDYFLERRTSRGLVLAREWVVWGNPVGYVTCEGAGINAYIYKALVDAAYLGNAIDETAQALEFDRAAKDLATAFNKVLWDEKAGTYYSGYYAGADRAKAEDRAKDMKLKVENDLIEPTALPALFALDQGIVPEARRASVTKYLLENRQQANRIMMFYYLFFQMYAARDPALDTEILEAFRTKWKPMLDWDWKTTWEEFDGASKAHIYGMFPGYFLSAYVMGVRPDGPISNRRLLIDPRLGDLTSVEGVVVTEFGPVPVSWKIASGNLTFKFTVPAGVKAKLRLPATGANSRLTLDGKLVVAKTGDQRFVVEVGPRAHQGILNGLSSVAIKH